MKHRTLKSVAAAALLAGTIAMSLPAAATTVGSDQGCTPGYWKNHTSSWEEYSTSTALSTLFTIPANLSAFGSKTMLEALDGGGGPGLNGAASILFRAASASYLNAANDSIGFPLRRSLPSPFEPWASDARFAEGIRGAVSAALATGNRDTILALATTLDNANNLGCPLN